MIDVIDDFMPAPVADAVGLRADKFRYRYGWHSNKRVEFCHWNRDLVRAGLKNTEDVQSRLRAVEDSDALWQYWSLVKARIGAPGAALLRCYANQHTYGTEGWPHTDCERPGEISVVLYLNREWKKEWAGETVVFDADGDIERAVLPRWNRVVIFPSDRLHVARGVSRICPHARTVLVMKVRP